MSIYVLRGRRRMVVMAVSAVRRFRHEHRSIRLRAVARAVVMRMGSLAMFVVMAVGVVVVSVTAIVRMNGLPVLAVMIPPVRLRLGVLVMLLPVPTIRMVVGRVLMPVAVIVPVGRWSFVMVAVSGVGRTWHERADVQLRRG